MGRRDTGLTIRSSKVDPDRCRSRRRLAYWVYRWLSFVEGRGLTGRPAGHLEEKRGHLASIHSRLRLSGMGIPCRLVSAMEG